MAKLVTKYQKRIKLTERRKNFSWIWDSSLSGLASFNLLPSSLLSRLYILFSGDRYSMFSGEGCSLYFSLCVQPLNTSFSIFFLSSLLSSWRLPTYLKNTFPSRATQRLRCHWWCAQWTQMTPAQPAHTDSSVSFCPASALTSMSCQLVP